jgi:hypothetical protein
MISFLKEPTPVAITGSPKLWEFRAAGVWWLRGGAASAQRIAPPILADVLMFPNHLSIRPDSRVASRWNTSGRCPSIRLGYHQNFIRLKLPCGCQSSVSRVVIDDHHDLSFWYHVLLSAEQMRFLSLSCDRIEAF